MGSPQNKNKINNKIKLVDLDAVNTTNTIKGFAVNDFMNKYS